MPMRFMQRPPGKLLNMLIYLPLTNGAHNTIQMRYVVLIVVSAVYGLWDLGYHDGAHTRAFVSEITRVAGRVF
jgi:hypothetical protein